MCVRERERERERERVCVCRRESQGTSQNTHEFLIKLEGVFTHLQNEFDVVSLIKDPNELPSFRWLPIKKRERTLSKSKDIESSGKVVSI